MLRFVNSMTSSRRCRLELFYVTAGIPPLMWYTVAVGALINMILIWMFDLKLRMDAVLGGANLLFDFLDK